MTQTQSSCEKNICQPSVKSLGSCPGILVSSQLIQILIPKAKEVLFYFKFYSLLWKYGISFHMMWTNLQRATPRQNTHHSCNILHSAKHLTLNHAKILCVNNNISLILIL